MTMSNKVWFITGASRGLGLEITRSVLNAGNKVVATARSPKAIEEALGTSENLLVLKLDVTKQEDAKSAVEKATIYASSKFAVEGWKEGLAQELQPLGIKAIIIEPGFFNTDFLDSTSV